jgi:hypothetical protein
MTNSTLVLWLSLAALYAGFRLWYDGGGGPLRPEEVRTYMERLGARGGDPARLARLREFLEQDQGRDFVMANFIHFRDEPRRVGDVAPGDTSQQALDRYMAHMYPALFRRACHPVLAGPVKAKSFEVWGLENADQWSLVGLVRYRSRRDMVEISTDPAFADAHIYKDAAMEQTIAIPLEPFLMLGSPRWLVAGALLVLGALGHLALRALA